jgi:DNA replication protein DnaC
LENFYKADNQRIKKYSFKIVDGEEIAVPTQAWLDIQKKSKLNALLKRSSIPNHVLDLSIDSIIDEDHIKKKLRMYVDEFDPKFKGVHLYFWSTGNGTQKTTSASILGKELMEKGYSVKFILMSDLTRMLANDAFEDDYDERRNSFLKCDFLIIDDAFDTKKVTVYKSGYQISFLDTFLRKRLEVLKKATCFTSNFSLDNLNEETFGTSLVRLLQRQILDPFQFTVHYSARNNFNPNDLWS